MKYLVLLVLCVLLVGCATPATETKYVVLTSPGIYNVRHDPAPLPAPEVYSKMSTDQRENTLVEIIRKNMVIIGIANINTEKRLQWEHDQKQLYLKE